MLSVLPCILVEQIDERAPKCVAVRNDDKQSEIASQFQSDFQAMLAVQDQMLRIGSA